MTRTSLFLLPLALVVLLPAASAAVDLYGQASLDSDLYQVQFDPDFTGPSAVTLRRAVDADGDGRVTASEETAWENARALGAPSACIPDGFDFIRLDGQAPARLLPYTYAKLNGVTGATDSSAAVSMAVVLSLELARPMRAGDEVVLRFAEAQDLADAWTCAFGVAFPFDLTLRPSYFFVETGAPVVSPVRLVTAYTAHDGRGLQLDEAEEIDIAYTNDIRFRYADDGLLARFSDELRILGLVLGGVVLLAALASLLSEAFRERAVRILGLGILPLYTRIKKEKALDHDRRQRLYDYIRDHQGATFSDLRHALDVGSGSLAHHLKVLEGQGFVKAYRDGLRDRFYLRGPKVTPDDYLTRTQKALLAAIAANPGIQQKDLASRLGLTRQSVQYHEKALAARGAVRTEREGRVRRYFPADVAAALPSTP